MSCAGPRLSAAAGINDSPPTSPKFSINIHMPPPIFPSWLIWHTESHVSSSSDQEQAAGFSGTRSLPAQ